MLCFKYQVARFAVLTLLLYLVTSDQTIAEEVKFSPCQNKCPDGIRPCKCFITFEDELWVECNSKDSTEILDILNSKFTGILVDSLYITDSIVETLEAGAFTNVTVRRLYLHYLQLKTLAVDAFSGLEETLEKLDVQMNDLEDIPNLQNFTELSWLSLIDNPIKEIKSSDFENLPQLQVFFLTGSDVDSVPDNVFTGLHERIVLSNNNITVFAQFNKMAQLREIWLDHNRLEVISSDSFVDLPSLKLLNLANNRISEFAINALSGTTLDSIEALYLSNNELEHIAPSAFATFKSLQTIDLRGNRLTTIGDWFSNNNNALKELILTENKIISLSESILWPSSLNHLRLSHNSITELNGINSTSELATLDLSNNEISEIDLDKLSIDNLTTLTLANNRIGSQTGFLKSKSLKALDMSNNGIESFHQSSSDDLPELEHLYLSGNYLNNIDEKLILCAPKLRSLYVHQNNISKIRSNVLQNVSKTIEDVGLRGNLIHVIEEGAYTDLENLFMIDLRDNRVETLPVDAFGENFPEILRLEENKLNCDCKLRWIAELGDTSHVGGTCSQPDELQGLSLHDVEPEDMVCIPEPSTDAYTTTQAQTTDLQTTEALASEATETLTTEESTDPPTAAATTKEPDGGVEAWLIAVIVIASVVVTCVVVGFTVCIQHHINKKQEKKDLENSYYTYSEPTLPQEIMSTEL